jgi:hypothetical protein
MRIEWNLWIDEYNGMTIKGEEGQEPYIDLRPGPVTADQHAALHLIAEIARALLMGQRIDHLFVPRSLQKIYINNSGPSEIFLRCQWMKSGKLIMLKECNKRWQHAETVDEAILRKRVFTCTRELYEILPKRRRVAKPDRITDRRLHRKEDDDG